MEREQYAETIEKTAPPALSDAIEKIMANPELISMVASALGREAPASLIPREEKTVSESDGTPAHKVTRSF